MDVMQRVSECIENRSEELAVLKAKGKKIVGIVGFGYTPEELIYAAGAIPQRLFRGGEQAAINDSRQYCHNCFSTFHKAQVGYVMEGRDPVYTLPDHYIFESGDEHSELTGMYIYPHREISATWLGVPGNPDYEEAFPYYMTALSKLGDELEVLTGEKITETKLTEYITVYNDIRNLLKKIGAMRQSENPPLSGLDFIKLNHASWYCDPHEYVEILRSVYDVLKSSSPEPSGNAVRLAIFGCPVGIGDYALHELLESLGGVVVTEELSNSTRRADRKTDLAGNPLESLARRYYDKKRLDVYTYPWTSEFFKAHTGSVEDYKVDGVIWYQLMYMACHSMFGYAVEKKIKKMNIPFITVHSEYDFESRLEAVKTRVETFMEIVKG